MELYRMKYTNHYWDEGLPWYWRILKLFKLVEKVEYIQILK